jgi:hypothetical protein
MWNGRVACTAAQPGAAHSAGTQTKAASPVEAWGVLSGDTQRSRWLASTMPHLTVAEEREYYRH